LKPSKAFEKALFKLYLMKPMFSFGRQQQTHESTAASLYQRNTDPADANEPATRGAVASAPPGTVDEVDLYAY